MIVVTVRNPGEEPMRVEVPEGKCPFEIMAAWQKRQGLVPAAKDPEFDAMMAKRRAEGAKFRR